MKKTTINTWIKWIFIFAISLAWILAFMEAFQDGNFIWGKAVHETGELAWNLLIFMIFFSLFQKISSFHFPKFTFHLKFLILKKWAGIFAFLVAGSHGIAEIAKRGFSIENILNTSFSTHNATTLGSISFLIMLPLFLTSSNYAIRKMGGKAWKNLQKFAHLAFIFAALHIALLDFFEKGSIEEDPLIILAIYIIGYGYLFIMKKNKNT